MAFGKAIQDYNANKRQMSPIYNLADNVIMFNNIKYVITIPGEV